MSVPSAHSEQFPTIDLPEDDMEETANKGSVPRIFTATPEFAGTRLDQFLVAHLDGISRSRIQLLLDQGGILVDGKFAKASHKLHGNETISVTGEAQPPPLRAMPEEIPLDIVFEDADLAVIDKPAG